MINNLHSDFLLGETISTLTQVITYCMCIYGYFSPGGRAFLTLSELNYKLNGQLVSSEALVNLDGYCL